LIMYKDEGASSKTPDELEHAATLVRNAGYHRATEYEEEAARQRHAGFAKAKEFEEKAGHRRAAAYQLRAAALEMRTLKHYSKADDLDKRARESDKEAIENERKGHYYRSLGIERARDMERAARLERTDAQDRATAMERCAEKKREDCHQQLGKIHKELASAIPGMSLSQTESDASCQLCKEIDLPSGFTTRGDKRDGHSTPENVDMEETVSMEENLDMKSAVEARMKKFEKMERNLTNKIQKK